MKTALADLLSSKKFLAVITASIVYLAGRWGFDVDPATLDRIYAGLLVFVGAQGLADHGKSAALIAAAAAGPPPKPADIVPGSSADLADQMRRGVAKFGGPLGALLLVLALGGSQIACGGSAKPVTTAAGQAISDCAKQDIATELSVGLKLAVDGISSALKGSVDWTKLVLDVEPLGPAAHCAFVAFYAALHKAPAPVAEATEVTATARVAPDAATMALERLRAKAGGVQWRLADGRVL